MDRKSLTKAEKRKLKKEEKKRERLEKRKLKAQQLNRDFLKREENRNNICLKRTKNEIEKWIESIALKDLKNDVFIVTQSLNRSIDKSQFAVETIETHRRHADEQYERNFRNHLQLIGHIEGRKSEKRKNIFKFSKILQLFRYFQNISHLGGSNVRH